MYHILADLEGNMPHNLWTKSFRAYLLTILNVLIYRCTKVGKDRNWTRVWTLENELMNEKSKASRQRDKKVGVVSIS